MKTRAIIIEDEQLSAERLHGLLKKQSQLEVVAMLQSVGEATDWLASNEIPDLLFLDIQLGDGTGLDVLNKIEAFPHVIFTTAFDQYVLEAFKYNSVDYLLKPIKEDALKDALDKYGKMHPNEGFHSVLNRLEAQLSGAYKEKFLVKIGSQLQSVPTKDIAYFFSKDGGTYIKTSSDKSLIIDLTLDELERVLGPKEFYRINRHLIVKYDHIAGIETYFNHRLILKLSPEHNQEAIVSRDKVKDFKTWLDS